MISGFRDSKERSWARRGEALARITRLPRIMSRAGRDNGGRGRIEARLSTEEDPGEGFSERRVSVSESNGTEELGLPTVMV